jgi:hypothetical protein
VVKSLRILIGLLVVGALGWLAARALFPSDKVRIQKLLSKLERRANYPPTESALVRIARINQLAGMFDTNCVVIIDGLDQGGVTLTGRDDLLQRALALGGAGGVVSVAFPQTAVTLTDGSTQASAEVAASVRVGSKGPDSLVLLRVGLEKFGREWLITKVETIKGLRM